MENNNSIKTLLYVAAILIVAIVAVIFLKKSKTSSQNENTVIGQVKVNEINISKSDSFPVEVNILAKGNLTDSCTTLGDVKQNYENNKFIVNVESKKALNAKNCVEIAQPFEQNINLAGVTGLTKGSYMVDVNGVPGAFILEMDNFISEKDSLK
jgi:inhibitor of cysteine peptidase